MTNYAADPTITMGAARAMYFDANHFGSDGGYNAKWVEFKLGPIPMPFPNTAARVRAVRVHDLHHVLTGYATDTLGEFEISAWEIGGGCGDYFAAWQLNLAGMFAGALSIPRRTWRAFLRGRRSRTLYREGYSEALVGKTVGQLRGEIRLDTVDTPPASAIDVVAFVGALLAGLVTGLIMFALMLPIAVVAAIAAIFRRRTPLAAAASDSRV